MNRAVRQVAERCVTGDRLGDDLVRGVEATLRAFDPCLSCAAHADGVRAVAVRLVGPNGEVLDESPPRPASPA
jgi:NAD-reducing hydrogenase large subunit